MNRRMTRTERMSRKSPNDDKFGMPGKIATTDTATTVKSNMCPGEAMNSHKQWAYMLKQISTMKRMQKNSSAVTNLRDKDDFNLTESKTVRHGGYYTKRTRSELELRLCLNKTMQKSLQRPEAGTRSHRIFRAQMLASTMAGCTVDRCHHRRHPPYSNTQAPLSV